MQDLLYNISQVLGITIINSVWQGFIIYLVLRILLLCLPWLKAVIKYNLSVLALLIITAWFAYTFFAEVKTYNWDTTATVTQQGLNTVLPANKNAGHDAFVQQSPFDYYKNTILYTVKNYLPYVSILYALGLLINLSQLLVAWSRIRAIKRNLSEALKLQQRVTQISQQLRIRKYIKVTFTRLIDVPCVIGYFKPILLLPVTLSTQLSPKETEAILLHELAHIKYNDYLINIIQQMIAVLLFFNPFAQMISRMISTERENRCDDIVVQTTGDALLYANALLKLEQSRQIDFKLALAATGKKYTLFNRIDRIMQAKKPIVNIRHLTLAILIFIGSLASISWLNPEVKNGKIVSENAAKAISGIAAIINKHIITSAIINNRPVKQTEKPIAIKRGVAAIVNDVEAMNAGDDDTLSAIHNTYEWRKFKSWINIRAAAAYDKLALTAVFREQQNEIAAAEAKWMQKQDSIAGKPGNWKLRNGVPSAIDPELFTTAAWKLKQDAERRAGEELDNDAEWKEAKKQREQENIDIYHKLINSTEWLQHQAIVAAANAKLMELPEWRKKEELVTLRKQIMNGTIAFAANSTEKIKQQEAIRQQLKDAEEKLMSIPLWKEQQKIIKEADSKLYGSDTYIQIAYERRKAEEKLHLTAAWIKKEDEVAAAEARFNNSIVWKKHQENEYKTQDKLRNSAEWQQKLNEIATAQAKLHNSPEWKKYLEESTAQKAENKKRSYTLKDSLKKVIKSNPSLFNIK